MSTPLSPLVLVIPLIFFIYALFKSVGSRELTAKRLLLGPLVVAGVAVYLMPQVSEGFFNLSLDVAASVLGAGLGWLHGHNAAVDFDEEKRIVLVRPSLLTTAFVALLFVIRFVVVMLSGAIDDPEKLRVSALSGFPLAFCAGVIVGWRLELYRRAFLSHDKSDFGNAGHPRLSD